MSQALVFQQQKFLTSLLQIELDGLYGLIAHINNRETKQFMCIRYLLGGTSNGLSEESI